MRFYGRKSCLAFVALGGVLLAMLTLAKGFERGLDREDAKTGHDLKVLEWGGVLDAYQDFRESNWPLVVPGVHEERSWDNIVRGVFWGRRPNWFWHFDAPDFRLGKGLLPGQREPAPVPCVLYEDIYNGNMLILGLMEDRSVHILHAEPVTPLLESLREGWPMDSELAMRRMVWRFNALPHDYIAPETSEKKTLFALSEPVLLRSGPVYPPGSIYISIARDETDPTNQVALTIHTPTGLVSRLDVFAHTNLLQDTPWTLLVDAGNVDANGKLAFQDDVEWFERRYYAAANADADTDNDGLPDGSERFIYKTDPHNSDTDNDGIPDGWEVMYGLNPLDASDAGELTGDGVTYLVAYLQGRDPIRGSVPDALGEAELLVFTVLE